jgi:hypothetical protein
MPRRWHAGCSYSSAEGGTSKKSNTGRPPPRSRSELAGSSEFGRGYEPRLKRQRTVLYDRLAWTFRTRKQKPESSVGWRDGSRQDRHSNPVSGSTHRDPSPGVLRTPVSREVGQHWGMSRLRSRHALTGVRFFSRCSAGPTPESAAHTAPPPGSPSGGGSFSAPWRESRYRGVRFAHRARGLPDAIPMAQALPHTGVSRSAPSHEEEPRCAR